MSTKQARIEVNDNSGFFSGAEPTHADVEQYFTAENYAWMFGGKPADYENEDFEELKEAAHEIIDERK